jgi:hypothetical protein
MSFESLPSEEVVLEAYRNLLFLEGEIEHHGSARRFVNELLDEQKTAEHMMNVVYPAADVIEPRSSNGQVLDQERQASKALIIGGVLASSVVQNSGGSQLLDRVMLTFPTAATTDLRAAEVYKQNCSELWQIGDETYREAKYHIFRALIEEWEDDLVAPQYQQFLRIGFGVVVHFVEELIVADKLEMHKFRHAVRNVEQDPAFNWDSVFQQILAAGESE